MEIKNIKKKNKKKFLLISPKSKFQSKNWAGSQSIEIKSGVLNSQDHFDAKKHEQ